jgi:hypothetical protein
MTSTSVVSLPNAVPISSPSISSCLHRRCASVARNPSKKPPSRSAPARTVSAWRRGRDTGLVLGNSLIDHAHALFLEYRSTNPAQTTAASSRLMPPPIWIACPKCRQKSGLPLESTGRGDHYECEVCGHVWRLTPLPSSAPPTVPPAQRGRKKKPARVPPRGRPLSSE